MGHDLVLSASDREALTLLRTLEGTQERALGRLSSGRRSREELLADPVDFYRLNSYRRHLARIYTIEQTVDQHETAIQATLQGLEGISDLFGQLRAEVKRALAGDTPREEISRNFQDFFEQILLLARDSSYQGLNLITTSRAVLVADTGPDQEAVNPRITIEGLDLFNRPLTEAGVFGAPWVDEDDQFAFSLIQFEFEGVRVSFSRGFSSLSLIGEVQSVLQALDRDLDDAHHRLDSQAELLAIDTANIDLIRRDVRAQVTGTLDPAIQRLQDNDLNEDSVLVAATRLRHDLLTRSIANGFEVSAGALRALLAN